MGTFRRSSPARTLTPPTAANSWRTLMCTTQTSKLALSLFLSLWRSEEVCTMGVKTWWALPLINSVCTSQGYSFSLEMTWAVYLFALLGFLFSLWQLCSTQQLLQLWETPTCQSWSITHTLQRTLFPVHPPNHLSLSLFFLLYLSLSHLRSDGVYTMGSKDCVCSNTD